MPVFVGGFCGGGTSFFFSEAGVDVAGSYSRYVLDADENIDHWTWVMAVPWEDVYHRQIEPLLHHPPLYVFVGTFTMPHKNMSRGYIGCDFSIP